MLTCACKHQGPLDIDEIAHRVYERAVSEHSGDKPIDGKNGFQWLDGSFVENKESRPPDLSPGHPGDIDVMMFMRRPANFRNKADFQKLLAANRALFDRRSVKSRYHVDIFTVDMGRATDYVLRWARYYLMLFSHRRLDQVWKGLLEVRQEDDGDDAPLLARLQSGEWP